MTISRSSLKVLAIAAAVTVVAAAGLLMGRPQPIESAVLGADWECTQTAFVLTTCEPRALGTFPALETSRKDAVRQTRG